MFVQPTAVRSGTDYEQSENVQIRMDLGKIIGRGLFEREENAAALSRKYFSLLSGVTDV